MRPAFVDRDQPLPAWVLGLMHVLQRVQMAEQGAPPQPSPAEKARSTADTARLERMFVSHHVAVWRTLRRRGLTPEAAADATQETFIVAAGRLADIEPDSERAFLIGTALRMAHTLGRKTTRWLLEDDMDRHAFPDLSSELADVQICDMALAKVKTELAEVFVLHEVEGLSSPEIAALLEIPLGSVASRLRRAKEQFRAAITRIQLIMEREGQP
jgi:RNA polymerase sigma-70 factor, ECF subfamily